MGASQRAGNWGWGVRGWTQPWRLGVTAGQLSARLPLALPSALAYECGRARGIPPPRESPPGPHLKLLEGNNRILSSSRSGEYRLMVRLRP